MLWLDVASSLPHDNCYTYNCCFPETEYSAGFILLLRLCVIHREQNTWRGDECVDGNTNIIYSETKWFKLVKRAFNRLDYIKLGHCSHISTTCMVPFSDNITKVTKVMWYMFDVIDSDGLVYCYGYLIISWLYSIKYIAPLHLCLSVNTAAKAIKRSMP